MPFDVVVDPADLPAAPLLPAGRDQRRRPSIARSSLLVPPMMLDADIYDVAPVDQRRRDPPPQRDRPVGRRLRRAGAGGGRSRALAHRPRPRRRRGDRPVREETGRDGPHRRLLPGRHVLLPGGRLPPPRGDRLARRLRQPGRHPRDALLRAPRGDRDRRSPRFLADHVFATRGGPRLDEPHRLPADGPGEVAAAATRLRPPAPRSRGAAAARAPAPLPRGRGLGRLARPGARRRDPPVRRPQPDASPAAS